MAGASNVTALARELGLQRELLYLWQAKYRREGIAGLGSRGRPEATAMAPAGALVEPIAPEARVAALERKIGQQQLELDFFRAALQRVRGPRSRSGGPGETVSTP